MLVIEKGYFWYPFCQHAISCRTLLHQLLCCTNRSLYPPTLYTPRPKTLLIPNETNRSNMYALWQWLMSRGIVPRWGSTNLCEKIYWRQRAAWNVMVLVWTLVFTQMYVCYELHFDAIVGKVSYIMHGIYCQIFLLKWTCHIIHYLLSREFFRML